MNLRYLTETFVPENLLFREEQINILNKGLSDFKTYGKGTCFIVLGRSGAGKTAALRLVEKANNGSVSYVSGFDCKKTSLILKNLTKSKDPAFFTQMQTLIKQLIAEPKMIIIDEVDRIKDQRDFIDCFNNIYRQTQVPIIFSTNNLKFIESLPEDAKTTLFFQPVNFPNYELDELYGILCDREKLVGVNIEEAHRSLLAGISAKYGSARLLLRMAYECIKENNFSIDFVREKVNAFEEVESKEFILKNTTNTEKKMLSALLFLKENNQQITINNIRKRVGLSKSTVSRLLDNIELRHGLIETQRKSQGGKGNKTRTIVLDEDSENTLRECLKL